MSNSDESRSRVEELIAIADRVAAQEIPSAPSRRWFPLVVGLLGVAALTAGVLGLVDDTSGAPNDAPITASSVPPGTEAATTAPPTTVASTASPSTTTPTTAPTTAPTTTVAATTVPIVGPPSPTHWADFIDGIVHLRGLVPDQATPDVMRERAAAVFGADNVVVEYAIDPTVAPNTDPPLYLRDWVAFGQNSVTLDDADRALLDVVRVLMVVHPQVTIHIDGHTDSVGPDDSNLELSRVRIDAIAAYLQATGVDPTRITRTAHGESAPIADNNTTEGRAKNRRIEFTLAHLFA